jgi:uncharacterized glyoxalase superfamily metalloenzyme YdcJ
MKTETDQDGEITKMLFNTVKNRNYTVEVQGYREVTSADGSVTQKVYDIATTTVPVAISTSFIGDLNILADIKFQKDAYLLELKDRNQNELYPEAIWIITQTQPVVNAVGLVEGYKYKAKILTGNT